MKKLLIILLTSTICLGSIILTSDSGVEDIASYGVVTIDTKEVTINNSEDIRDYMIGIKP